MPPRQARAAHPVARDASGDGGGPVKVSLFGLGYVGCVSAACFARSGLRVVGVDVNQTKVDLLNAGQSPIVEKDVDAFLHAAVADGMLRATTDARDAVDDSDVSLLCVGTPSLPSGALDLGHIWAVAEQIGLALRDKATEHVVVIRSTVMPGTADRTAQILAERSGKERGRGFAVVANPEFLREGTAVADFLHPPYTILGGDEDWALDRVATLYHDLEAPLHRVPTRVAEMLKYANNAFHATKVVFANEIGNVCKALGIDSHQVMDLFCRDTKLNLSSYYFKPGFAFGGSCLPKDVRALVARARELHVPSPLLDSLLPSNVAQVKRVVDQLLAWKARRIGFLGLAFKGGTDDLRESPLVEVLETMLGKGYDVRIYDANVSLAKLTGANKEYIEKEIPHIDRLMCASVDEVLAHAEVIVVGNRNDAFREALGRLRDDQKVLDLVRIVPGPPARGEYHGICW
jgi:GDP-mannose 6-dehydrogenase